MVKISFDDPKNFAVMLWCGCVIIFIVTLTLDKIHIFFTERQQAMKSQRESISALRLKKLRLIWHLKCYKGDLITTILWLIYFFCRWNLSMLDSQSETAAWNLSMLDSQSETAAWNLSMLDSQSETTAWNLSMLDSQSETAACVAVLLSHISK